MLVSSMVNLGRKRHRDVQQNEYTNEYIRLSHVDLAIDEILSRDVPGHLAEVGVYQGHMAAVLNAALPERSLYLFDTFEGFDSEQEKEEYSKRGLTYSRDFSDTSLERVLSRMPHPDQCKVRKGLFPATSKGLENEKFAFVSLDPDLFQPIYDGLSFFILDYLLADLSSCMIIITPNFQELGRLLGSFQRKHLQDTYRLVTCMGLQYLLASVLRLT